VPLVMVVAMNHERQELAEASDGNERWEEIFSQLQGENEGLESELRGVRSQLETERADRQQVEAELAELKTQTKEPAAELHQEGRSVIPSKDLPEPADVLNQLKARRKKSKADLADVEEILEILGGDIN
jgi:hypothetical protein